MSITKTTSMRHNIVEQLDRKGEEGKEGTITYSRISGRMTSKPPISARISITLSPLVMPPSTFKCFKSVLESSFMLSRMARVWKAFASRVARAMWAGVVYDERPGVSKVSLYYTQERK